MTDDRPSPPMVAGERDALRGWLSYHRATLAWKCDGLDDEQLRTPAVRSSSLTLLGLLRHAGELENHWFRRVIGGGDVPNLWSPTGDFQEAFAVDQAARGDDALAAWSEAVEESLAIEAAVPSLDTIIRVERWQSDADLRMLLLHVIHEYARHTGHADLIREAVDGVVGP